MSLGKKLPTGTWITVKSLPLETTETEIQDWLKLCGVELPLDRILVVANHWRFAQAIVSMDHAATADLFRRATLAHKFKGQETDVTFKATNRETIYGKTS